jgi:hypothetical protein
LQWHLNPEFKMCRDSKLTMLLPQNLWRLRLSGGLTIIALLCGLAKTHAEASVGVAPVAQPLILSGKSLRPDGEKISAFVTEVIRLLDAKLDAAVIKAYIGNTAITYNPSATELIVLQQHGAGADTLIALMQRAAEAGARTSPALPTAPSAAFVPVYRYAPQMVYQAAPENDASPGEASYPTNYEASAGSPVYYAAPAYYSGVGLPGFGPDTRRPPLREDRRLPRNVEPANGPQTERARPESAHPGFSPPAGHVAPAIAHGTPPHAAGHAGGAPGGRRH